MRPAPLLYRESPIRRALRGVLDAVMPPVCAFCGRLAGGGHASLCVECRAALRPVAPPFCRACGWPFEGGTGDRPCGECIVSPPAFDVARAAWRYEGPLREALIAFKFRRRVACAPPLASLLADALPLGLDPREYDFVCPVPLHPRRLRERGFNQSLLLARRLTAATGLPLRRDTLVRTRPTVPQVGLPRKARRENVRMAFEAARPIPEGARVLLVDDVITTGATVSACAAALKRAGASVVDAAAVARVIGPEPGPAHPFI
ncbi:ComF family protein [bacterium]|nr:ComF family protein [bacterium]